MDINFTSQPKLHIKTRQRPKHAFPIKVKKPLLYKQQPFLKYDKSRQVVTDSQGSGDVRDNKQQTNDSVTLNSQGYSSNDDIVQNKTPMRKIDSKKYKAILCGATLPTVPDREEPQANGYYSSLSKKTITNFSIDVNNPRIPISQSKQSKLDMFYKSKPYNKHLKKSLVKRIEPALKPKKSDILHVRATLGAVKRMSLKNDQSLPNLVQDYMESPQSSICDELPSINQSYQNVLNVKIGDKSDFADSLRARLTYQDNSFNMSRSQSFTNINSLNQVSPLKERQLLRKSPLGTQILMIQNETDKLAVSQKYGSLAYMLPQSESYSSDAQALKRQKILQQLTNQQNEKRERLQLKQEMVDQERESIVSRIKIKARATPFVNEDGFLTRSKAAISHSFKARSQSTVSQSYQIANKSELEVTAHDGGIAPYQNKEIEDGQWLNYLREESHRLKNDDVIQSESFQRLSSQTRAKFRKQQIVRQKHDKKYSKDWLRYRFAN